MKTVEIMRMRFKILLPRHFSKAGWKNPTLNNAWKSWLPCAFLHFDSNMHPCHYKQLFWTKAFTVSLESTYHLRLLQPRFHSGRVTKRYYLLELIFNPNCSVSLVIHLNTQSLNEMEESSVVYSIVLKVTAILPGVYYRLLGVIITCI